MPTYALWTESALDDDARARVATAVTEIHAEVGRAPRYFVQVVFHQMTAGSFYVAGSPATAGHVWLRADIRAGRTDAQKREMLRRLTTEIGEILDISPNEVWVYIDDIPGANIAEWGRPLPDPGQEDAWFAALPDDLREQLRPLQ